MTREHYENWVRAVHEYNCALAQALGGKCEAAHEFGLFVQRAWPVHSGVER